MTRISNALKIHPDFVETVCRIKVTHPGVTAAGIVDKMEQTGEGEAEGSGGLRTAVTEKWIRSHSSTHPLSVYQYCFTVSLDSLSDK